DQEIEGTLEQILFVNETSGYLVGLVDITDEGRRRHVTIVGTLTGIEVGGALRLSGHFEKHPKYGEQFRVVDYELLRPAGVAALERSPASEIKGAGRVFLRRIVTHFGESLTAVLDTTPERLHEVPGLPRRTVRRIATAWQDSSGLRELSVFLRGHGIAGAHAK